jgi:hypothetical protein
MVVRVVTDDEASTFHREIVAQICYNGQEYSVSLADRQSLSPIATEQRGSQPIATGCGSELKNHIR